MKGLILAAGRGSRMKNATAERPKCLTKVAGRTLLELQRSALTAGGIKEHGIVTGYLSELLQLPSLKSFHNPRWQETNMVQSLLCAADWLRTDTCVVSYSDIFYPVETVRRLSTADGDIVIAYDPEWEPLWRARFADPLSDAETFRLADGCRVIDIGARPQSLAEVQGQYMGLLRISPSGFAQIAELVARLPPDRSDKLDMTSLLSLLIADGAIVLAVPTAPDWGEIDSESDLHLYEDLIRRDQLKLPN